MTQKNESTTAPDKDEVPAPGSWSARQLGCICPRIDNHYGKGRGGNGKKYGWYTIPTCPLKHTQPAPWETEG